MGDEDDRLKLDKLLNSLEKDWVHNEVSNDARWAKIEESLTNLARARELLEELDPAHKSVQLRNRLDRLDGLVAEKVSMAVPAGPAPPPTTSPFLDLDRFLLKEDNDTSRGSGPSGAKPTSTQVSPPEEEYIPYQVKPRQAVRHRETATRARPTGPLESTRKVQDEISHELAQMAGQLKKNALHFSGSLEKDKAVLEAADQQLDKNYDKMLKTQTQTKTMSSKRSGTTCFVFAIVLGVSVAFFFMVLLIRAT